MTDRLADPPLTLEAYKQERATPDCKYCRSVPNGDDASCTSLAAAHDCPWMSRSDWEWLDLREKMRRPEAAIANLRGHQVQCDADGVMIQVSRQALDEVLTYLATLTRS